jgi:hypothetical protein
MPTDKDATIRNPERGKQKVQEPYEPIYRQLGLEPKPLIDRDMMFVKNQKPITETQPMYAINPMQETFSSFDGQSIKEDGSIVDDFDQHYIDNNEFVFPDDPFNVPLEQEEVMTDTPNVGDYILMVFGKIVCFGDTQKIENRIEAILYGEDKTFVDLGPTRDDIVVLRRVDVKVGVSIK